MCYAAYSKGTAALLCAVLGAAEQLDVRAALYAQWTHDATQVVQGLTAKAWRFEGEMREISATFAAAGMPGEFHLAAAEMYRRLAPLKNKPGGAAFQDVLDALCER
jgi:hypothetical protein